MRNSNCLVLLLAILSVSMAARIYPWGEPYIRWPNSGYVKEMNLYFSLETKLPKGHYLRLQLPFTTQPSISVTVYQQTASRGTVSQPSTGIITSTQVSAQSTAPFNMYYRFSEELNAGIPYVLRITFDTQPADAGWLGYVQMETMSPADSIISGTDTPITYDLNNAFAPIHILPAPGAPTVSWGAVEPTATPTVAATQYVQPIQIVLSQDFWYQPTILITWSNSAFSIADGCKSADTGVSSTVVTPATDYTCSTDQTNLRVKINHNARILRNETVTYNLTITTPAAGGSATFSVFVYHRWNMNLTDILESGPTLTVTAPSSGGGSGSTTPALSAVRALLSWGIDPKNELNSVTNSFIAISAGEFQSIRFAFDLNTALSSGTYTVKVQLCATAANCDALENSIYHSFGASATCNVVSGTDVSVSCSVSSIQQTNNFVAVKVKYLTSVVTTNAITESGFGQITITSSATGFSTINAIALDSAYKKAFAPTKTLSSPNQNGPIIGLADTTAWGYITDATDGVTTFSTGATGGTPTYLDLMGGIFASTSTDATMNVALLTKISQGLDVSGGSDKTVWGLDSSGTDKGHPAKAGIDLIMNPNLWTAVSSVPKGTCWAAGAGKKPTANSGDIIAPGDTTYDAHCYAKTNGTPAWTRLRFISIAAVSTTDADDHLDGTLTFFWPGFVKQTSRYVGASLKADNLVGDYYVAYYTTTATVAGTNLAATGDLGELGGATLTNTVTTITANDFFTQYHLSPVSVTNTNPTVSTNYAGLEVFISGTKGAGLTADQSISLLRARGTLASGTDAYPSSAQLILFFAPVASDAYSYLAPAGSATESTSIRCFTSASGVCNLDRPQRLGSTGVLNAIDYYQVVSTIASFSTTATSLAIALATNDNYASEDYRVGWLGSTTGMAWIAGKTKSVTVTTTATSNAAGGSSTCASDWGSSTGSPVPPVRPVMDRSSTSYYVNNQISSIAFKYRITDDTNYVTPSAGRGGFTWCAQWDFRGSSTVSFSNVNNLEKNADKCVAFDYQSSTPTKWYCIYCPVTSTSTALTESDASFTINNFKASQATDINTPTYSVVYNDAGELLDRTYCDRTLDAWIPGSASASTTGSAFAQVAQKVTVTFSLGSTGKDVSTVVLQGRQSGSVGSLDTTFPQSTFESNAECWIAPSASVTLTDFKKLGSCPTTGSGALTFTLPTEFSAIKSQSGFKLVLWGLTGNAAPSPAPTSQYFILYSNDASGSEIDMTKESPSVLGDLVSWPVLSTINNFTVTAPQYTRPLLGSRGTFRWDFTLPSVRPWYYLDNIVFSLDAMSTASENANTGIIQCRITDSAGAVNQNFKSCTFSSSSSPATITIVSLGSSFLLEFAATGIRVNLDGVKALVSQVSSKTIYGRHYFGTSSNSVALTKDNTATDLIGPTDVSAKAFPSNYPVITKYWGNAQGVMDVAFTLISSATVTEQFRITIEFPTYYNPGLTTRSIAPVCSVDGVNTNCQVIRPRTLQIDGFANSKNANVQFIVRVSGIAAPVISTADSFWIQINSDRSESASTVIYAGSLIEPVVASQTIVPLHVNWFTPASGSTRSITTLTWTFNPLGTEDHGTTRAVQAVFPPHWGLSTGRFTPTCNVQDWANPSTVYTSTQSAIVSNTVTMNIAQTLIRNRIVNLVCQNVRVAENDGTYPSQDVQIRIVDQNGTAVYQASAPSVHNVNFAAQWAISSNLNYINWGDASTTWTATPTVYVLPRGTYSLYRSVSIVGRSARTLQLAVSPAQFTFQASPYNVTTGDDDLGNFIGTAGSTPINTYSLLFSVNDGTYFVPAPSIWVQVTMDKTDLVVSPLGDVPIIFSSGVTSKSNPVVFTAYFNAPYSDVTITPSVDSIYSANFTVSPSSITLTPSFAFGTFVYTTTGSTQSGETNVFKYALSGTNANSYNTPAIHNVKAVADSNVEIGVTPVLAITADGTDQGRATYKVLNFALSGVSTATVYFGCQVAGTWSYDADGIYTAALTWYGYDIEDPFHGYYDLIVMTKASETYTVTGLAPNSNYECRGFAISNGFKNSTVASHAFRTASNGAQINRWLFNTSTYPTAAQRQALLCTLTQTLRVPPQNVIAVSGEICGNSTTFYNTANTSMIAIYFYPLNVESDAVMTTTALQTALNGTSTFNTLNRTVVANGGPSIFNIYADGTPQKNQVTLNVPSTIQADLSWLAISGVTLNETGYVVAALASQGSSAPTPLQLKQAATQSSSLQVQSGYYDANLGSLSFNFSGLDEDTPYSIYVVGTNNDPSWFQNSTAVNALQGTTTKSPTNGVTLFCSVVMAFVAVISLIFV